MTSFTAQIQPWNNEQRDEFKTAPMLVLSNVASSDAEDEDITSK